MKTQLFDREAQVWSEVAADGTDPDLLAAIVVRAAADPRGFARQWRQMLRTGHDPMQARNDVARTAVLTSEPGMAAVSAWRDRGVRVTLAGDSAMPDRLVQTGVQPPWLAMQSMAPAAVATAVPAAAVAIVGSRKATAYGRGMASWLAESAGSAGIRVVSGGAVGIDAAAHGAALATAGATTVVLGCGHDVVYPRPHATPGGLFAQVVAAGGQIVSESLPFDAPRPFRVRSRNRLIAAMADVVVVVEGGSRSGSLVTANWAADLGIPVLAVPGDARAPGSAAPLQLLREGAGICAGPNDLLAAMPAHRLGVQADREDGQGSADPPHARASCLPPAAAAVLAQAWPRATSLSALASASGVEIGPLMAAVTAAQVAREITRDGDGLRLCRGPSE